MRTSLKPSANLSADAELQSSWWERNPNWVPAAAKHQLSTIKQQLAAEAEAIEGALRNREGLPAPFIIDAIKKRGIARKAALHLASDKLKGAVISGSVDLLDIRFLAPHGPLAAQPTSY
jgi:hypothetical protein